MTFLNRLEQFHPTLYQIHKFIVGAKELGYGEVELIIKTHDYVAKIFDMKAIKPKKKTLQKSVTKRIMVLPKKNEVQTKKTKK